MKWIPSSCHNTACSYHCCNSRASKPPPCRDFRGNFCQPNERLADFCIFSPIFASILKSLPQKHHKHYTFEACTTPIAPLASHRLKANISTASYVHHKVHHQARTQEHHWQLFTSFIKHQVHKSIINHEVGHVKNWSSAKMPV